MKKSKTDSLKSTDTENVFSNEKRSAVRTGDRRLTYAKRIKELVTLGSFGKTDQSIDLVKSMLTVLEEVCKNKTLIKNTKRSMNKAPMDQASITQTRSFCQSLVEVIEAQNKEED